MKKLPMVVRLLIRIIAAAFLLGCSAFCLFGFFASFEPGNEWWWQVGYLGLACGSFGGAAYLLLHRRIKASLVVIPSRLGQNGLVLPGPSIPPEKDFRSAFKVAMEKHQAVAAWHSSMCWVVLVMALGCMFLASYYPSARTFGLTAFVPCALLLIILLAVSPTRIIKCPACTKPVSKSLGDHCPECGGRSLKPARFPNVPHPRCESCAKELRISGMGGQNYRSRYCSHCGVLLDSEA